jgi:hypothetical protein
MDRKEFVELCAKLLKFTSSIYTYNATFLSKFRVIKNYILLQVVFAEKERYSEWCKKCFFSGGLARYSMRPAERTTGSRLARLVPSQYPRWRAGWPLDAR